jgi:hypothetical protein
MSGDRVLYNCMVYSPWRVREHKRVKREAHLTFCHKDYTLRTEDLKGHHLQITWGHQRRNFFVWWCKKIFLLVWGGGGVKGKTNNVCILWPKEIWRWYLGEHLKNTLKPKKCKYFHFCTNSAPPPEMWHSSEFWLHFGLQNTTPNLNTWKKTICELSPLFNLGSMHLVISRPTTDEEFRCVEIFLLACWG